MLTGIFLGKLCNTEHTQNGNCAVLTIRAGGIGGCAMVADEFFGLPEFVVSRVVIETAGAGNFRIYNYVLRGSVLMPQFMALVAAPDFLSMISAVEAAAFGADATGLHIARPH